MNRYVYLIILFVLMTAGLSNGQWIRQKIDASSSLNKIYFVDQENGWILTGRNTIFRTTNGGNEWNPVQTDYVFWQTKFVNKDVGFAITGDYAQYVCKTTNGGITWEIIFTLNNLISISVVDQNNIFISTKKMLFGTKDGGIVWNEIVFPPQDKAETEGHIISSYFVSNNVGWVLFKKHLYITKDGGSSFEDLNSPEFFTQYFVNINTGFGINGSKIYKTTNSGYSWSLTNGGFGINTVFQFINENTGYLLGYYEFTQIDGSWKCKDVLNPSNLVNGDKFYFDFWAVDENNIWVIGENGLVAKRSAVKNVSIVIPSDNQIVYTNYSIYLRWDQSNLKSSKGRIEYSINNGAGWQTIADTVKISDQYYLWNTKGLSPCENCLMRIYEYENGLYSASAPFKLIKESREICMAYPAKGSVLFSLQKIRVNWTTNYSPTFLSGDLCFNYGQDTTQYSVSPHILGKDSLGYYFTFPNYSGKGKLKIYDRSNPHIFTISEFFTMVPDPPVKLVNFHNGDIIKPNSPYTITFRSGYTPKVDIQFSANCGMDWDYIKKDFSLDSLTSNTYSIAWQTPDIISSRCKLRILSKNGSDSCWLYITNKDIVGEFPFRKSNKWFYKYFHEYPITSIGQKEDAIVLIYETNDQVKIGENYYYEINMRRLNLDTLKGYYTYGKRYLRQADNRVLEYANNNEKELCDFTKARYYNNILNNKYRSFSSFTYGGDNNYTISDSLGFSILYYSENNLGVSKYYLVGAIIDNIPHGEVLYNYLVPVTQSDKNKIPSEYTLCQNYPNPFNPVTTISYSIPQAQHVSIKVFDMLGREVATLVNEEKSAGTYHVQFNGGNLSSGTYLYRLIAGIYNESKKFILLK